MSEFTKGRALRTSVGLSFLGLGITGVAVYVALTGLSFALPWIAATRDILKDNKIGEQL